MNDFLLELQPTKVWQYFKEILNIPHPSKREDKLRAYLIDFAQKRQLSYKVDDAGNVLITKPAVKGYESAPTVVLQSHIDMVCEKNNDTIHDFDNDPIKARVEDGWIKAAGTTLGADNGIGVALELALLDSQDIEHGLLECLFTTDEETGLTGAIGLKSGFFTGKTLINLDSEDDGQFFMGCAGGINTYIKLAYSQDKIQGDYIFYALSVKGLKGGHSGDDINKGRENAIKLCNRMLLKGVDAFGLKLIQFTGGNLHNAIPREATAIIAIPSDNAEYFEKYVAKFYSEVKKELPSTEPNITIEITKTGSVDTAFKDEEAKQLIYAISCVPAGVVRMAADIPNFVETSTNLASITMVENGIVSIVTSQRSSVESRKYETADAITTCFKLIGAKVEQSDGYPGWTPNINSPILKLAMNCYKKLFNETPIALAIHAGLECGLFSEKYPGLDMVSYGPTMRGVHSPDERLEIKTVEKFWQLTLEILKSVNK